MTVSGHIDRAAGFTLLWNGFTYYYGDPLNLLEGGGAVQGYSDHTTDIGFQLPPASAWLPAGYALSKLTFSASSGNDGNGWSAYSVIQSTDGSVYVAAGLPVWTPASPVAPAALDALQVRVRLHVDWGGVPNTFARVNTDAYSRWFVAWEATAIVPTAGSGSASRVTARTARLSAAADGGGASYVASFEYGLTTGYGAVTPDSGVLAGAQTVNADLAGLAPGTLYHARLRVLNTGTGAYTYGTDFTFTTARGGQQLLL